jgi:ATP-dependent helicase/nuclease subunit A
MTENTRSNQKALLSAIESQRLASDPNYSVCVSASAGTGKTKMLTDRVLRMLLAGEQLDKILCITFTNAAAYEMISRIKGRLKNWLLMPLNILENELNSLSGIPPTVAIIERARSLYGTVIDNIDSLQIKTIHAFCLDILRRFEMYATVPANFDILDDIGRQRLLAQAITRVLAKEDLSGSDPEVSASIIKLSEYYHYPTLCQLVEEVTTNKSKLSDYLQEYSSVGELIQDLYLRLEADITITPHFILEQSGGDITRLRQCAKELSESEYKSTNILAAWVNANKEQRPILWNDYSAIFLTKTGEPRLRLFTKALKERFPNATEFLEQEKSRVGLISEQLRNQLTAEINRAFVVLILKVLEVYEELKYQHKVLEYDDLISSTIDFLSSSEESFWALYQLDMAVNHVLVDEAQDVSPKQWELLKVICQEFFAGLSVKDKTRTIFVVGDFKQSIYSFQGADPQAFLDIQEYLATASKGSYKDFKKVELSVSFRTTSPVLDFVNRLFNTPEIKAAVGGEQVERVEHVPFRGGGGAVHILPLVGEDPDKEESTGWRLPMPELDGKDSKLLVAKQITNMIVDWLVSGKKSLGHGLPISPSDIMILVRRRSEVIDYLVQALNRRGVPVNQPDRILLSEDIIANDLIALAKFILLPEDDLNLAILLKSPLIGLSEDELFIACYKRPNSIWEQLPNTHAEAYSYLTTLQEAALISPSLHSFYHRVLFLDDKIVKFVERFGKPRTQYTIQHFMRILLDYPHRTPMADLQSFINWFEQAALEIKNNDHQGEGVRIMTIHAAKGLQAPIVILADAASSEQAPTSNLFWDEEKMYLSCSEHDNEFIKNIKEKQKLKDKHESLRLLYVAMTRAEDELYIAGWQNRLIKESWYRLIESHLTHPKLEIVESDIVYQATNKKVFATLPEHFRQKITATRGGILSATIVAKQPQIFPFYTEKSFLHNDGSKGAEWGNIMHRLLEVLPSIAEATWEEYITKVTIAELGDSDQAMALLEQARKVIFAYPNIFYPADGSGSYAEVSITGELSGSQQKIIAKLDKIIISDNHVQIIDFKTDQQLSSSSPMFAQYQAQLNLYRGLLQQQFPNHKVTCYLLWTRGPELIEVL